MARSRNRIALVAHGGAGAIGPAGERPERRRGMMAAMQRGAKILRDDGSALEAVIATVVALEDHPLFNAGYGALLNSEGNVEMDASVMVAEPVSSEGALHRKKSARTDSDVTEYNVAAGAVAAVSRVRNPVALARAVMEHSPHILMAGPGAESFARKVGVKLVRPEEMVTERARERWRARMEHADALQAEAAARAAMGHGTVGAVAVDRHGAIAAATSTGGVPGKLYGRVGDSALIGAGTFAHAFGAASATGQGEAIILTALCREAVLGMADGSPQAVAREAIDEMIEATGAEAGIILVDKRGRIGFAHNAGSMQVARYDAAGGMRHLWLKPIAMARRQ